MELRYRLAPVVNGNWPPRGSWAGVVCVTSSLCLYCNGEVCCHPAKCLAGAALAEFFRFTRRRHLRALSRGVLSGAFAGVDRGSPEGRRVAKY